MSHACVAGVWTAGDGRKGLFSLNCLPAWTPGFCAMQDHSASFSHEVLVAGLSGYLADGPRAKNAVLLSTMNILVAIWRPDYTVTLITRQEFQGTKTLRPDKWVS